MSLLSDWTTFWIVFAVFGWWLLYGRGILQLHRLEDVGDLPAPDLEAWPTLSVVVPACNEADRIESALETLIDQDYPHLEIVAVDDRSTDATGEIIDRLAERHDCIEAVHVETLPDGWLGKVHALHTGVSESTGDWLLLTDADVHFRDGVLRRVVAAAETDGLDQLALIPDMQPNDFWHRVAYAGFVVGMLHILTFGRLEERGDDPVGVGAFNLVRRSMLEQTEGFEWLRMEVADDVGLGEMISRAGGTSRIALADRWLDVEWYDSLSTMVRGLEKNTFGAVGGYSYLQTFALTLFLTVAFTGPFYGAVASDGLLQWASLSAFGLYALFVPMFARRIRCPWTSTVFVAVGHWLMVFILLRSAYYCWRRGGIDWRGTTYSLDDLREHQRIDV